MRREDGVGREEGIYRGKARMPRLLIIFADRK